MACGIWEHVGVCAVVGGGEKRKETHLTHQRVFMFSRETTGRASHEVIFFRELEAIIMELLG